MRAKTTRRKGLARPRDERCAVYGYEGGVGDATMKMQNPRRLGVGEREAGRVDKMEWEED